MADGSDDLSCCACGDAIPKGAQFWTITVSRERADPEAKSLVLDVLWSQLVEAYCLGCAAEHNLFALEVPRGTPDRICPGQDEGAANEPQRP